MPTENYYGFSIPEPMKKQIEKIIKDEEWLGYKRVTEFIKDAIRRHFQYIADAKKELKPK